MSANHISPTTELEAVNIMLSGIGESPVNSLVDTTADVAVARNILTEVAKETQLEGFHWNTEDDYPLMPDASSGNIRVPQPVIRVHFREPDARELTIRGDRVYDRANHTYAFPPGEALRCTVTLFLPFDQMPETARRYVTLKALRIFQERVVGSDTLSQFQQGDEARARVQLMGEERRADRPNLVMGTLPPVGTWRPHTVLLGRFRRQGGR